MRIRPAVVGAVAAVSMFGAACGNPETTESAPTALDMQQSSEALQAQNLMGLGADHSLVARASLQDELKQTHTRYEHLYRGVRVWEGDTVVHNVAGQLAITGKSLADIQVSTTPKLTAADARSISHSLIKPKGAYAQDPSAELIVYPQTTEQVAANPMRGPGGELTATDIERVAKGYVLAYHVHSALENGAAETKHVDYIIDANTGDVLKQWDSLETAAATGTGNSQYSGTVSLATNSVTSGWEMRDVSRTMNYATYNLNHGTSGTGTIYTDADNTWGDGANYTSGGSTTAANGQTAAVDAHFGIGATYDYYKNVHGRNGIDGTGKATYNRVHYSSSYDNAFWDDTCFCMTYGDGSSFKVLTAIDVAGHEMTHGVTANSANLTYSGESGGLNEATSDIGGTMVEFYRTGAAGATTIPNTGGTWTIGEQLSSTPLRWMYKPSKDGSSADAWYSGVGNLDVHYSSGPMNRAFYFLSQGSSSSSTSDFYSSYLPGGMTGIGNDHAARIGYRALTVYETSSTNYAGARTAYLSAAADLYGTSSADYAAVQNAFAAINVGSPAGGGGGGGGGTSIQNGGFESGATIWTASTGVIYNSSTLAHAGSYLAYLDGYGTTTTDTLSQAFTVPSTATTLTYWLHITTSETTTTTAYDTLTVQLKNSAGTVLATQSYSNLSKNSAYAQKSFTVSSYRGQALTLVFTGSEDSSLATSFYVDDVSVQ